jgi:asparagine synthase (glutamine-hydrolysing)
MCGIAGFIHPEAGRFSQQLEGMLGRTRHRGRDDSGIWHGGSCILGHNRLSIIDLSNAGHQPMGNEDGSIQVILNGEIYNYRELRTALLAKGHRFRSDSDTEVLPHLYEEYGPDFVSHLRGMFAIALWDIPNRKLLLVRDRGGKKPLFYARIKGGLVFASEMKAFFGLPEVDFSVNDQAVHDYLTFGVVPGESTVYSGICRVPPASVMTVSETGTIATETYWTPDYVTKRNIGFNDAVDLVEETLRDAVKIRLRSDVPLGCFLSGGIDSGLICALAARELDRPLKTFSIGFADQGFDERPLARRVADQYGTDHREFVLESNVADVERIIAHYDEPYSDASALPSFAVTQMAAEDVSVVLNGDGGDEIFAGYRHFIAARSADRLDHALTPGLKRLMAQIIERMPAPRCGRTPYQFLHRFLRVAAQDPAERFVALTSDRLSEKDKSALYGGQSTFSASVRWAADVDTAGLGPVDAMLKRDFHRLLGDDHLVKMDMASMAWTLEARSPFLDHALIDLAASLPEDIKLGGNTTKPLLRALAARHLPDAVVNAPKRGFEIPLLRWMSHDLNPMLHERVLDPSSYCMTRFDRRAVETLLNGEGWDRKRWSACVWGLLCLEFWWTNYRNSVVPAAIQAVSLKAA